MSKAVDGISARDVAATDDAITLGVTDSCCTVLLLAVLVTRCNVELRISDEIVDTNATSEDRDNIGCGDMESSEKNVVSLDRVDNVELTGMADSSIEFKDESRPLTGIDSSDDSNINSRREDGSDTTGVLTEENVSKLDPEGVTNSDEVPYTAMLVSDASFNVDEIIECGLLPSVISDMSTVWRVSNV